MGVVPVARRKTTMKCFASVWKVCRATSSIERVEFVSSAFARSKRTLDIKTQYRVTDKIDAYLDVTNVFDEPDSGSEFFGGRTRNIKDMSALISLGMNIRL